MLQGGGGGDGSWHVERNYDVKEDARVLDGKKIPVGQREIKEETGAEVGRCRGGNGS